MLKNILIIILACTLFTLAKYSDESNRHNTRLRRVVDSYARNPYLTLKKGEHFVKCKKIE